MNALPSNASPRPSWIDYLLVVPDAQLRIFDLELQGAYYSVFHRSRAARIAHMICMPLIVWAMLALAALVPVPTWGLNASLPLVALMAAWYLRLDRRLGLAALPILAALWATANLAAGALGAGWLLCVLGGAGAVQTLSHGVEEIPPPYSGSTRWIGTRAYLRSAPPGRLALFALLSVSVFVVVEIISSPRLLPILILRGLWHAGFARDLRAAPEARAARILHVGLPQYAEPASPLPAEGA